MENNQNDNSDFHHYTEEFDKNLHIDEEDLNGFSFYVSNEIKVVDLTDINWDDDDMLHENILLTAHEAEAHKNVPEIAFVNEETSNYICEKCKKKYKRKHAFEKHTGICGRSF